MIRYGRSGFASALAALRLGGAKCGHDERPIRSTTGTGVKGGTRP